MKCAQIAPYLPGYAGGDLRLDTHRIVADHIAACSSCHAESSHHERVVTGLATLATKEIEPPAYLVDAILEGAGRGRIRRVMPVLPLPSADAVRALADHRELIASAAGTMIVAAGAAYALWRAVRSARRAQPVIS